MRLLLLVLSFSFFFLFSSVAACGLVRCKLTTCRPLPCSSSGATRSAERLLHLGWCQPMRRCRWLFYGCDRILLVLNNKSDRDDDLLPPFKWQRRALASKSSFDKPRAAKQETSLFLLSNGAYLDHTSNADRRNWGGRSKG